MMRIHCFTSMIAIVLVFSISQAHAEFSCTEKENPCDEKERCEYEAQIQMKSQLRKLFESKKLRNEALNQARNDLPNGTKRDISHRASTLLYNKILQLASDGKTIVLPDCGSQIQSPLGWETDVRCNIHPLDGDNPVSEDQARRRNTCMEFNDAARVHELYHRIQCQKELKAPEKLDRMDIDTFMKEEAAAYKLETEYLKDFKSWKRKSCTPDKNRVKKATDSVLSVAGRMKK